MTVKLGNAAKTCAIVLLSIALTVSSLGYAGGTMQTAYAQEQGTAPEYQALFENKKVIDVKVTIADEDWKSILASPLDKDYKNVAVEVDGIAKQNVGFSTKGNLTLKSVASMSDSDRYSFRLKFDKYDKTQTLLGLDKMVLNNSYSDPSYLREYLHYEALRKIGLDAPLTVFTNLYINGELYGFYVGVEAVDDSYLERNYGEDYNTGVLYDTDEKSYLQYKEDSSYDSITYETGEEDDKASLKHFISVLNAMPEGEKGDIENVLDVDSALKYIAANSVLGNYDSYNGDKGHNYMLYGDAAGKYTVVPWDFNMSFNGYSGGGGGAGGNTAQASTTSVNSNATTASVDVPALGISMESVPMINNLLKVPEFKAKYMTYVVELVEYLKGAQTRITELADLIRPYVAADPTKFYTMEQFEANVAYSAAEDAGNGGMQGGGFSGIMPPQGSEGMTPPDGTLPDGIPPDRTPPDGAGTLPADNQTGGGPGQGGQPGGPGQGMGTMAAGSLMTFALNRLANLEQQLGLEVTPLPQIVSAVPTPMPTPISGILLELNGSKLNFSDQQPVNQNGRILAPVRAVVEALGAEVTWNNETRTVTATKGDTLIQLTIGSQTAYLNGAAIKLDVPAAIIGERTLVPIRFISEALNLDVNWNSATSTVLITDKK